MKHLWKRVVASLSVLALIVPLCLGCGDDEETGKVTIVIGEVMDLTGSASTALIPVHYVIQDVMRYYNEEELIPGVELKLATYDQNYNPAKDIPGYEWCKERGAEVILVGLANQAELLKPFAERDKVAIGSFSSSIPAVEPPGWVFCFTPQFAEQIVTLLDWISENDWDYEAEGRPPKLGFVAWRVSSGLDQDKALTEYCQAHPDKFKHVASVLPPPGTLTFGPEVEALKDCDYILPSTLTVGYFIRDYLAKGLDGAKFISDSGACAFYGFFVDMVGWEGIDGVRIFMTSRWWGEPYPTVELAEKLLYEYRAGKADYLIHSGAGYVGGVANVLAIYEILEQAVEEVGAVNFDGQAFYDAATKYEASGPIWEGYPKWCFSDTVRSLIHDVALYEWSAEVEDMVRITDWLPLIEE